MDSHEVAPQGTMIVAGVTRRIDSRRFSIGPMVTREESTCWSKKLRASLHRVASFVEGIIRESAAISAFCLVVIWIAYFSGLIDRDVLLIANGILIGLMIVAALLRQRYSRQVLSAGQRFVRRPFPRGAVLRSASHPDVTHGDRFIVEEIRLLFVSKLLDRCTQATLYSTSIPCPSCVVCLMEFESDQPVSALKCEHLFHTQCLFDWFSTQLNAAGAETTCPTCRTEVKMDDESMQEFISDVCSPLSVGSRLSRRVHVVFQNSTGSNAV
jgi:hypothetical protein